MQLMRRTTDQRSPIENAGELFSDGRSIELIRDTETGRLLVADRENCPVVPRVESRRSVSRSPTTAFPKRSRAFDGLTRLSLLMGGKHG